MAVFIQKRVLMLWLTVASAIARTERFPASLSADISEHPKKLPLKKLYRLRR